MINEIIEQIGGRERLEFIVENAISRERIIMARALLAVLDAQEEPVAFYANGAYYNTKRAALKDGAESVMPLYTTPPAASVPDVALDNFKEAMQGIGHIRRTLEETFGGLHGTHCEPDVLMDCKQICDAIYSAYRAAAPAPGGE